jgi:apolipoprotein D and lipocalin family protein
MADNNDHYLGGVMRYTLCILVLFVSGCIGVPEGIRPVEGFKIDRYLGQWYEIARLDHSFERDLEQISAEYNLRDDGGVKVINRGLNTKKQEWSEANGKAFFVDDKNTGHLKVSFFGPFYGSYIIFELGENYEYAFITSSDKSYLWLLSRTPKIEADLMAHFIKTISELGFDKDALIFVDQTENISDHVGI